MTDNAARTRGEDKLSCDLKWIYRREMNCR